MAEWVIVNGHVLGRCAYLRSLDEPWEAEDQCDCRDLLAEDDEDEDDRDDDWLPAWPTISDASAFGY